MAYKHKIVEGLSQLIDKYGGKSKDPMMAAIWWGIKGQIPSILQSLDENEKAIAEIRDKLMEVLDIKPQITEVSLVKEEVKTEEQTGEFAPVAEMEIAVEPIIPKAEGDLGEMPSEEDLLKYEAKLSGEEAPPVAEAEVTLEPERNNIEEEK